MTMNVSVRVPDGIVLASDSLASSVVAVQQQIPVAMKCQNCGHDNPPGLVLAPPIGVPGSSTPLATKIFYIGNFGLTFFGASSINGRSLFNHVMFYRTTEYKDDLKLEEIAKGLAKMLTNAIKVDPALKNAPQGSNVGGFQISGYDKEDIDIGRTIVAQLNTGQDPLCQTVHEYGVTVTGYQEIAKRLCANAAGAPAQQGLARMTIPDAIDYARFLVQTTSDYHRFADTVPTVGGPTEIALITKWIGFRWVERKKILPDDTSRLNVGKISHEIGQIRRDLPGIIRKARETSGSQGVEP